MPEYIIFSRKEVLHEEIDHVGQRVKADTIREASAIAKKWIRFEAVKEFFIVSYEAWCKDPDFGKLRLDAIQSRPGSIKIYNKNYDYRF